VDVVPASALDRHTFATIRPVGIALDAVPDWSLLRSRYPADQPVALLDGERERDSTLGDAERELGGARFLVLPPLEPFADLASLATVTRIAERLRAPNGCPWDREQTHQSLRPHLLEEAYEALEALDSGDLPRLRDELGDLLLQIALHAQLAHEEGAFDIDDSSFLGELLFDLVAAAREKGFDAETALREANERFVKRVSKVEERARREGRALESYAPDQMRRMWEETA